MAAISAVIAAMEHLAPPAAALPGDNIGLQAPGSPKVQKILLTLDVDVAVVNEARRKNANLIIAHHPVIYKSLERIGSSDLTGRVLTAAIRNDIGIYVAHTNLDCARGGVNDVLARRLELRDARPLQKTFAEKKYKVVTFVPEAHADKVRAAMCEAGGGHIGEYSYCTFQTPGTGTFLPSKEATPFIGTVGKINKELELRLEALAPEAYLESVVKAMKTAHPYEEVAYDVYQLAEPGSMLGLGRAGNLPEPVSFKDYVELVKRRLGVKLVRTIGPGRTRVKRVAVCGGSGGDLLDAVAAEGAQVFVTGEIKYHQILNAGEIGICVIEAGHGATERVVLPALAENLQKALPDVQVMLSRIRTDHSEWV